MNRRSFFKKSATAAAVVAVAPSVITEKPPLDIKAFFDAAYELKLARNAAVGCSMTRASFKSLTPADISALLKSESEYAHPA